MTQTLILIETDDTRAEEDVRRSLCHHIALALCGEFVRFDIEGLEGVTREDILSAAAPTPKPVELFIVWGESPEDGAGAISYEFATEGERDAFLKGVDEMDGWAGYEVVESADVAYCGTCDGCHAAGQCPATQEDVRDGLPPEHQVRLDRIERKGWAVERGADGRFKAVQSAGCQCGHDEACHVNKTGACDQACACIEFSAFEVERWGNWETAIEAIEYAECEIRED